MLFATYGVVGGLDGGSHPAPTPPVKGRTLSKAKVQSLLADTTLVNLDQRSFSVNTGTETLRVETTLAMPMQHFIMDRLNTSTARYIGIVAMSPTSGKILAMVGFDSQDADNNPCVDNRFPAASVFKIVTAAAAIETQRYGPDTPLSYNGRKYTLYKSQIRDRKNRWTRKVSLKDSFAQSVNPVFGKIGALVLGRSILEQYALAFGFNHPIDFEITVGPSTVALSDDPYQWAEIASGFNRETRISPLHGALMAAAILNQGHWIAPTIVARIVDAKGQVIYTGRSRQIRQALKPEASRDMSRLMAETIRSGTCRKSFRGYRQDKVLSRLNMGAKTGSIYNSTHDTRYDWFVGYAAEKSGPEKIVLSIVVAHEEFIGVRASTYAKMAIRHHFKTYFASSSKKGAEG